MDGLIERGTLPPGVRRGAAPLRLAFALLLAILCLPGAAPASDARALAELAVSVHDSWCAQVSAGDVQTRSEGLREVADVWGQLDSAIASGAPRWLMYWRGALAQCLRQTEPAVADFQAFLRAYGRDERFPSLVQDARKRLRRMSDDPLPPPSSAPVRVRPTAERSTRPPAPRPTPAPESPFSDDWPLGWPEFGGRDVELVPGWSAQLGYMPDRTLAGLLSFDLALYASLPSRGYADEAFIGVSLGALGFGAGAIGSRVYQAGLGAEITLLLGERSEGGGELRLGLSVLGSRQWNDWDFSPQRVLDAPMVAAHVGGAAGGERFHFEWGGRFGVWGGDTIVGNTPFDPTPILLVYLGVGM